jgi:hypothetical protein
MPKITLGSQPKTFLRDIKVPLLDGSIGEVKMCFKYRTQTEFAQFIDELVEAGATLAQSTEDMGVKSGLAREIVLLPKQHTESILRIAEGWNLDKDFSRPNIQQLCEELPGVANAIINEYRACIREGRSGN